MMLLSDQCAATLAVMDMRASLNAQAEREAALARAASALNARLDLQAVLEALCHEVALALGGDMTGFYLGDGNKGGVAEAAHGMAAGSDWYGFVMRPGEGVAGQVLQDGRTVVSNAYQSEVEIPDTDEGVRGDRRWRARPLGRQAQGRPLGGLPDMRPVNDEDIEICRPWRTWPRWPAATPRPSSVRRAAARTDSLTGLLNHGAVHMPLHEEIARAAGKARRCPACWSTWTASSP